MKENVIIKKFLPLSTFTEIKKDKIFFFSVQYLENLKTIIIIINICILFKVIENRKDLIKIK